MTVGGELTPLEYVIVLSVKDWTAVDFGETAWCVLDSTSGLRRGKCPWFESAVVCVGRLLTLVACDCESYETKLLTTS